MRAIAARLFALSIILPLAACAGGLSNDPSTNATSQTIQSSESAAPACPSYDLLWGVDGGHSFTWGTAPLQRGRAKTVYQHIFGLYPCLNCNDINGVFHAVLNGGIPQAQLDNNRALLNAHLAKIASDIATMNLPPDYDGAFSIDYEGWAPLWPWMPSSWAQHYRDASLAHAQLNCPSCSGTQLEALARQEYEEGARVFMVETLRKVREILPNAKVGYYAYPRSVYFAGYDDHSAQEPDSEQITLGYCTAGSTHAGCLSQMNDLLHDINDAHSAFFPSLYQFYPSIDPPPSNWEAPSTRNAGYITSNTVEAVRLAHGSKPVYPYIWHRYFDGEGSPHSDELLNPTDLRQSMTLPYFAGAQGVFFWGFESTEPQIAQVQDYINAAIVPTLDAFLQQVCR